MHKMVKRGAAVLMLTCMAGNAMAATAASGCVRPDDLTALKAAAVQQKLMVAAFSCDAVKLYNDFVKAYQKELQASDRALQNFFRRLNNATGTEDYHAYKTRLANASSIQSIGNMPVYCADAKAAFDASLTDAKTSLVAFISGQITSVDNAYAPCQILTAGVAAPPPANVPLPRPKPGEAVIPAQGGGLSTN